MCSNFETAIYRRWISIFVYRIISKNGVAVPKIGRFDAFRFDFRYPSFEISNNTLSDGGAAKISWMAGQLGRIRSYAALGWYQRQANQQKN